jgi:penicillin-binding protein 1C
VQATDQLPEGLRVFTRNSAAAPRQTNVPPPSISFPPDGATVPLADAKAKDKSIMLKADGGRAPLTWLIDGRIIGSFGRFQPVNLVPPGEGFARITVVDASGRSDTSKIRFKRLH